MVTCCTPSLAADVTDRTAVSLTVLIGQNKTKVMLGSTQKAQAAKTPDPCLPFLDKYTECVAQHSNGLTEGDDCSKEGSVYKDCRKTEKLKKKSEQAKK